MLVVLFKIWCTFLVLTIPCIIVNDLPKKPGGTFDMIMTILTFAFVTVDFVLVFALMILAIWD